MGYIGLSFVSGCFMYTYDMQYLGPFHKTVLHSVVALSESIIWIPLKLTLIICCKKSSAPLTQDTFTSNIAGCVLDHPLVNTVQGLPVPEKVQHSYSKKAIKGCILKDLPTKLREIRCVTI